MTQLTLIDFKKALGQSGGPLCRLRAESEDYVSWNKAIAFFSGGLLEDVPREMAEGIKRRA